MAAYDPPPSPASAPVPNIDVLELTRVRLELAVDAAAIGSFDWDLQTNSLTWDERMNALIGQTLGANPTVEDFVDRILPADRAGVEQATQEAIRSCTGLEADFRFIDDAGAT